MPIARLDDELGISQNVKLMKLDAEGAEPLIFRGAELFLRHIRPVILCENRQVDGARHQWSDGG